MLAADRPIIATPCNQLHSSSAPRADSKEPHIASEPIPDVGVQTRTEKTTLARRAVGEGETPQVITEMSAEYKTVSRDEPYEVSVEHDGDATREKGEQKEQRLRYGGLHRYASLHKPEGGESSGGPKA